MDDNIQLFEDRKIRTAWNETEEEWYFSVVDVIEVLTDSNEPRRYWSDLKRKLNKEGASSQLYENIVQLKMKSHKDGKSYKTRLYSGNHGDYVEGQEIIITYRAVPSLLTSRQV